MSRVSSPVLFGALLALTLTPGCQTPAGARPDVGAVAPGPAGPDARPALLRAPVPDDEPAPAVKASKGPSLQQQSQNPVADLVSLPFQYNSTFNSGRRRNETNVLNIQPVYPVELDDEWNLINRLIVPLTKVPSPAKGVNGTSGLGDSTLQMFLSPAESDPVWGVGPIFYFPTASSDQLGTDQWGLGPTAAVLRMEGPWVYGAVGQHIWSVGGPDGSGNELNSTLVQPFANYNMEDGWYLVSSPIITANWKADTAGDIWNVPLGGGVGRLIYSRIPVNLQLQGFYNVHHPRDAGNWSLRFQATLLFPKDDPRAKSAT